MANWYKNLYVGETAKGRERKIRHQVNRGRFLPGLYLITYAANEKDQLDIIESRYLVQKRVRNTLPEIIGVAFGYQEALEIVREIAAEAFENTGDCDFRHFLQSNTPRQSSGASNL